MSDASSGVQTCFTCGWRLPATEEYFHRALLGGGLRRSCKPCQREEQQGSATCAEAAHKMRLRGSDEVARIERARAEGRA